MIWFAFAIMAAMFLAIPLGRLIARRAFGPLPQGVSAAEIEVELRTGSRRRSMVWTPVAVFGGAVALAVAILLTTRALNLRMPPTISFVPMIPAFIAFQVCAYRLNRLAAIDVLSRRGVRSLCARCSYALTGSVSTRCPECGFPLADPNVPHTEDEGTDGR